MLEVKTPEPGFDLVSEQLESSNEHRMADSQQSSAPPTQRTNSDASTNIPIRRRSLFTPGIATRGISAEDTSWSSSVTQSSASPVYGLTRSVSDIGFPLGMQGTQDYLRRYQDPGPKQSSDLEYLATLQALEGVHPRTATPSELDYGHLGSFKLGSLRITNGEASPSVSLHETESIDLQRQRDHSHHTSSLGEKLTNDGNSTGLEAGAVHKDGPTSLQNHMSLSIETEPTLYCHSEYSMRDNADLEGLDPALKDIAHVQSVVQHQDFLEFNHNDNPQSPASASEMAQAYMLEIPSSPFSFEDSPPPSPTLQTISKPTAFDDDEVRASIILPNVPPKETLASTRQSPGETQDAMPYEKHQNLIQAPQAATARSPDTVDSGYCSSTTPRSSGHISQDIYVPATLPLVPDKSSPPTPSKTLYARQSNNMTGISIVPSTCHISTADDRYNNLIQDGRPTHQLNEGSLQRRPISQSTYGSRVAKDLPSPPKYQGQSAAFKQSSRLSLSRRTENSQSTMETDLRDGISPTADKSSFRHSIPSMQKNNDNDKELKAAILDYSASSSKGKLKKQRSRSSKTTPVTVQCYTEIAPERVPSVTPEATARLEERLRSLPLLTHTYNDVHETNPWKTPITLPSLDALEQSAKHTKRFEGRERRTSGSLPDETVEREMTLGSSQHNSSSSCKAYKSINREIGNEKPRKRNDSPRRLSDQFRVLHSDTQFEEHITSVDAVTESLGASPYEIAMNCRPRSASASSMMPNDASNERGRLQRMDSFSASQFAREKSERRRSRSRRLSYDSRASFDDRGGVPGKTLRPYSMAEDIPPIPSIPQEGNSDIRVNGLSKRIKSPPPVAMATQRRAPIAPSSQLVGEAIKCHAHLATSIITKSSSVQALGQESDLEVNDLGNLNPDYLNDEKHSGGPESGPWEAQKLMWTERKRLANGNLEKNSVRYSMDDAKQLNTSASLEGRPGNKLHTQPALESPLLRPRRMNESPPEVIFLASDIGKEPLKATVRESRRIRKASRSGERQPYTPVTQPEDDCNTPAQKSTWDSYESLTYHGAHPLNGQSPSYDSSRDNRNSHKLSSASHAEVSSKAAKRSSSQARNSPYGPSPLSQSQVSSELTSSVEIGSEFLTIDRYNGGLAYGYEPGYGLGGSAGMRNGASAASRKSLEASLRYGVDLSDVPIFVTVGGQNDGVHV